MLRARIGAGPMSTEIVEAVFRYSHYYRTPLMLIPSKNQIDHSGGYVNGWTTRAFADHLKGVRGKYVYSDVSVCRDHCGPGFNGIDCLNDSFKTIEADIENGFQLIHIDFCHFSGTKEERFAYSRKAVEFCLKLNPEISLEIGTDENVGVNLTINDLSSVREELDFFLDFCSPEFYVVQTGSLIKEIRQVGCFNPVFVESVSKMLHERGVKIKEHNADYLEEDDIGQRNGLVDAMNIAPQLGVLQTSCVIHNAMTYGVNYEDFVGVVYNGKKWKKWMVDARPGDPFGCAFIAGHYHFTSDEYKRLVDQLERHIDIHEVVINAVMEVLESYHRMTKEQSVSDYRREKKDLLYGNRGL